MLDSIFYFIVTIFLSINVFLTKRTNSKIDFVVGFPVNLILVVILQGIVASILMLVNLDITILNVSIAEFIISVLLLLSNMSRKIQKYDFKGEYVIWVVIIIAVAFIIFYIRFGSSLVPNFASVDGSHHMGFAYKVFLENRVATNMLLPSVTEGLLMQAFSCFIDNFYLYKIFLVCEVAFYVLSGWLFMSISSVFVKSRKIVIFLIIFTLFYYCGYPLYTLIFGFSYLGFSVSCITLVIFLLLYYYYKNNSKFNIGFILAFNISLSSIGLSYTLFVPIIFVSVLVVVMLNYKNKFRIFSMSMFTILVKLFLFPSLLIIIVSLKVGNDLTNINGLGGLSFDGACINDLYSSLIILMPLAIFSGLEILKNKKITNPLFWLFNISVFVAIVLFVLFLCNKVSIYYFSKIDSLLGLVLCCLNVHAITLLSKKAINLVLSMFLVLIFILGVTGTLFDEKLQVKNERSVYYKIENYVGIHAGNRAFIMQKGTSSQDWIDIYKFVYQNTELNSNEVVFLGGEININWSIISMQFNCYFNKSYNEVKKLINDKTKYFVFEKSENDELDKYLSLGDIVKENDSGVVIKIRH